MVWWAWTLLQSVARWMVLLTLFTRHVIARFPGPCSELQPFNLLQYVATDRYRLAPGMELVYDEKGTTHAYRFTPRASTLSFPASSILTLCHFFPEEFSILITLRTSDKSAKQDETIFALVPRGSTKIKVAVRLYKGRLHIDFVDRLTKRKRITEFRSMKIFDKEWHTIVLSITADRVSLRTDCGKTRSKKLKRLFPALLNTRGDNIHIANSNTELKGLYSGLLKQLILLPGSDIGKLSCPPRGTPDLDPWFPSSNQIPTQVSPMHLYSVCTWQDTGRIWFDIYGKTMKVCYSGIWQPVLLPPEQRIQKRMDYLVWHQDIVTAAPTIDIEVFHIPDEGLFMATASYDSTKLKKQQSAIFKWDKGRFKVYQSLYTLGAQAWEHFQIGKQFFLAVANHGSRREKPSKSAIYKWSRHKKRFQLHQEIVTWTARDIEYFSIDASHYLIVANHVKGQNHTIESVLYKWDNKNQRFEETQMLHTTGAYDWTYFSLDGFHFLAVANAFSGPPLRTTKLSSVVYFWQPSKDQFLHFQDIQTTGATDWEFFKIEEEYFLAVANAYNYGPHTSDKTEQYMTNSTIYRLNRVRKQFEKYQDIVTHSAVDWEAFTVGDSHYLVVSNAQQGATANTDISRQTTRSVIYRWQGVEKFVPQHHLDTLPSADWESFQANGDVYLVYANANDNISQVYKVKLV